ncbi:alpha/beta hydrolase [Natronomonas amylolytica]|uniref:alpha/beta hydrolase n=1 Tax=Natronomonas amylolytica TaxID=3108498 RepID=UPI0030095D20
MALDAHEVEAADGTRIRLWEVPRDDTDTATLFVHGATYPGLAAFGPPGSPDSWLAQAADNGTAAFAVDLRGYGDSERPASFDADSTAPETVPSRAAAAATDVEAALDRIRERFERVHLVGYSWGSIVCGRHLTGSGGSVASLTQFAPVYRPAAEKAARWAPGEPPSPARRVTRAEARQRWDRQFPDGDDPSKYRPDGAFESFWDALADSGQSVPDADEPTISAPNGTLLDLVAAANGDPVYDAADISVPTLVVRGSLDPTATRKDALTLYDELGCGDDREYVEIAGGTHFMPLERRHGALFEAVAGFQKWC